MNDDELGGPLAFRIWVTRGSYFRLSDGLKVKASYSNSAIAMLSFYVICGSIVQIAFAAALSHQVTAALGALSLILSVFILVMSLLENGKEYRLEAEYALRTAHELETLYNKVVSADNVVDPADRQRYSDILGAARSTRRRVDYVGFQLANPEAFKLSDMRRLALAIQFGCFAAMEYGIYMLIVMLPLIGAVIYACTH